LQHAPERRAFCHPFLNSEGVKPIEIHRQMKVQYGDACLSLQKMYKWTRKFMNGIRSDKEVQQVVHEWLCSQPKEFFSRGIHALPKFWNTCMERNGDYIGKRSHCVPFVFNKLRDKKYLIFKVFI
jgi:hypothetical protein